MVNEPLGRTGGSGAAGGQALDREVASRRLAEVVGPPAHDQLGDAGVAAAGDLEGVAGPVVGQGLLRRRAFDRHGQVARHQQQRAEGDRLARAQVAVGQDPADQRQQIDQGGV